MPHLALTYTRLRAEERLVLDALERAGADVEPIDLREVVFDVEDASRWRGFDAVFDRSLSLTSSLVTAQVLETMGVRCINPARAIETCGDKIRTSLALVRAGVATPGFRIASDPESALEAINSMGYPAVTKPAIGSWGRLVTPVRDRAEAEAVLEHRQVLGSLHHRVTYVQEHIEKSGRDLRVFVVAGEAIAAIARYSDHFITNTARGGRVEGVEVTRELGGLAERAATCVGADLAAVDLLECPRRGLLVNEVNHSLEFRNSIEPTGVDIPGAIASRVIAIASASRRREAAPV